ncbi:MAG: hypothetical protein PWP08_1037 [Methanofollis sp.]|nr:hypothetical protein [Methanofollis sp.]
MIRIRRDFSSERITVSDDVIAYIEKKGTDFRVSTSCGGPILLPVSVKPPKNTDVQVGAGRRRIYVSMYQAPYIDTIDMALIPFSEHD